MEPLHIEFRKAALQSEAEELLRSMTHKPETITVEVSCESEFASVLSEKRKLFVHPLFLLGLSDLPKHLQAKNLHDPRLKDPQFFQELKKWLSEQFSISQDCLTGLESLFRLNLGIWQKSHLIERTKHFALAHEMAHVYLKHSANPWEKWVAFALTLLILIGLPASLPLLSVLCIAYIVHDISLRFFTAVREYSEQYQEKEADLKAIELTGDYLAAKHFFKTVDDQRKRDWNESSFFNKLLHVIFVPEKLFNCAHPSPQTRIQYLREAYLQV